MKITSGILKGMPLRSPEGMNARPTLVRARTALLDSIGSGMEDSVVVDLFAGTGALGLEAASRGAAAVTFVDSAPSSCKLIRFNIAAAAKYGPTADLKLIQGELPGCVRKLSATGSPDYIFADPPYAESSLLLERLLNDPVFTEWSAGSILIWEIPPVAGGPKPPPSAWIVENIREFAGVKFFFFRNSL